MVHEVYVDDESAAKADEVLPFASQLRTYYILHLPKLVRYHHRTAVPGMDVAVIALGRYIYQPIHGNSQDFRPPAYK